MAESTKRTWTGLFLYTVFSCLWAYAYQVVFVCVLLVGILVAASTCKARNLLSGVARAVWQAELWVHRLYVTDSVLCVPRVESITLGTVWWTFVYFLLTKAVLTAYFAAIFTSLLGEYTRFRVDSTPTLSPYVYRDRWQTQPPWYETSENSAAAIVVTVLVSFIFNIYMVWMSTWWTDRYYTWMVSLVPADETRMLPHFHPYRLPNAIDPTLHPPPTFLPPPPPPPPLIPFSSQSSSGSVYAMGAPPPQPPQLEHKSSSQSSLSSVASVASSTTSSHSAHHFPSSDRRAMSMAFQRSHIDQEALHAQWISMQSQQSPAGGTQLFGPPTTAHTLGPSPANPALHHHPLVQFSSTLTERHGVVGFPVPPPPLRTSSSSGRLTDQHLQRTSRRASIPASPRPPQPPPQPPTRSKSSRKKDLALRTKHEHKLESMVDHARHQVQALHHILSTLKLHHDSHAVAHARRRLAVLNQLVAHAPLSQDERLQFELACHEFAAVLDNNNESDDESQQDDDAHVFDTVIESAQGHLRYIQHVWAATTTTDTTSVVPHETVSDLRGQLGAIIKSLQLVPPQWPRRQALEQQCHALDTDLTAWLVRQDRDKKEQLRRQLDAMQHTLVHGVGLSDDNKAQLQRICDDLEAKLVAMEHAPPPMPVIIQPLPPTTQLQTRGDDRSVATDPPPNDVLPTTSVAQTLVERYAAAALAASNKQVPRSVASLPSAHIVREVTMEDVDRDEAVQRPDDAREVHVTLAARSGWESPVGYAAPPSSTTSYDLLSPTGTSHSTVVPFAFTPSTTYDQLSPISAPSSPSLFDSTTFAIAPTFRSATAASFVSDQVEVDPVHFQSFGPPTVCRDMPFKFSIWAFLAHQRDEAVEEAMAADASARQVSRELLLRVRRGALAHVTLELPSSGFQNESEPTQVLTWTGAVSSVRYNVLCTSSAKIGQVLFKATIVVGTEVLVVVKTIRASALGGDSADQIVSEFRHEAAVLSMFGHHPHIVPFVGASTDPSSTLALVTEYLPFGTIEDQFKRQLSAGQKTRIVGDAAAGLLNMHEGGFIHRDIAARNCLVDGALRAKVCDFGLCRRVHKANETSSHFEHGVGPLKYMAPESLQPPHVFSTKSDAFAFGVLVWETFAEKKPFAMMTAPEAAAYVLEGGRCLDIHSSDIPNAMQCLMAQCFQEDPELRPSMTDIVAACRRGVDDLTRVD
ncbi:hypothetical protein DYB28_003601 [Aphanomyces astaci]|uniref:Protein kinase domain-containing protein n=1 Tax=Aphanomyces astaci TaxID=112090 RepID=A0A9X8H9L9_APHAT|nr:hypothetical protein DYB28_003601 [Aphanomyces astaci]